jgi:Na+/H+-dicarboxylate symporter
MSTSVIAVLLAVASAEVIRIVSLAGRLTEEMPVAGNEEASFSEFITSLMPPSIFEPFVTISPLPLIILATLFTYAFCSVGKFFGTLKTAVDAGYVLCSRVLSVIMSTLPFFVFTAILDLLLSYGVDGLINQLVLFLIVCISLVVMAAFYAVRLKAGGVKVIPFVKDMIPLIYENFRINSVIDAVPYNIRYCARTYKIDRKRLESFLPVLAQINLDGNCYMLTIITLTLIFGSGTNISAIWIAAIGALVLFLSLGAPNQPGSCIIGMVIIFNFLVAQELLPLAILAEVFFGGLLNIINVIGDIVTVATTKDR